MKYLAHIVSDIVMSVEAFYGENIPDNHYEITEEQFVSYELPCHAELTEDGVVFGDIVPWDEVPDTSEVVEGEPEPTPEPELTVWEELDKAYQEGVDSV